MNGKYRRQAEIRWTSRDAKRLEHIKAKRESKTLLSPQDIHPRMPIESRTKDWGKCAAIKLCTDGSRVLAIRATANVGKTEESAAEWLIWAVANGEMTARQSMQNESGGTLCTR